MRRAAKKDWNQGAIVDALRAIGVTVFVLNAEGLPDLLTHDIRGRACSMGCAWLPIEVKRPRGKLTPAQKGTRSIAPFPVVETVDQALALFGVDVQQKRRAG